MLIVTVSGTVRVREKAEALALLQKSEKIDNIVTLIANSEKLGTTLEKRPDSLELILFFTL